MLPDIILSFYGLSFRLGRRRGTRFPSSSDSTGLFFLRFFITSSLGFGFGHELSLLGLAIPASALVVNLGFSIHPYLATGLRRRNFRTGCGGVWAAFPFFRPSLCPEPLCPGCPGCRPRRCRGRCARRAVHPPFAL